MHIPGHLALALAQHRLLDLVNDDQPPLAPMLSACLLPDAVDKSIGYFFRWMPNGRHYSHNVFSLILSTLLVTYVWGRPAGRAWFISYLGHLLADSTSMVPWLFPLKRYAFERGRLRLNRRRLLRESPWLGLVLILYCLSER